MAQKLFIFSNWYDRLSAAHLLATCSRRDSVRRNWLAVTAVTGGHCARRRSTAQRSPTVSCPQSGAKNRQRIQRIPNEFQTVSYCRSLDREFDCLTTGAQV